MKGGNYKKLQKMRKRTEKRSERKSKNENCFSLLSLTLLLFELETAGELNRKWGSGIARANGKRLRTKTERGAIYVSPCFISR